MHNCVRTCAPECAKGDVSVWSLQAAPSDDEPKPVLTIVLDNHRKVVTEYRGRHNMLPNEKRRTHHQVEGLYLHLLGRAPSIMNRWMERENLQHWQDYSYLDEEPEA